MHEHRAVQPRQIYASTVSRRGRRRTRRRGRNHVSVLVGAATLLAALTVLAALAPVLS